MGLTTSRMTEPVLRIRVPAEHVAVRVADLLMISTRLEEALTRAGFEHLGDLDGRMLRDVCRAHGLGPKTVIELRQLLAEYHAIPVAVTCPPTRRRPTPAPPAVVRPTDVLDVPAFAVAYRLNELSLPHKLHGIRCGDHILRTLGELHGKSIIGLAIRRSAAAALVAAIEEVRARGPTLPQGIVGALDDAIERLNDRRREVLLLRHGGSGRAPMNLSEIGFVFKLSRERVRQIEKVALAELRVLAGPVFGHALRELEARARTDRIALRDFIEPPALAKKPGRPWDSVAFYAGLLVQLAPGLACLQGARPVVADATSGRDDRPERSREPEIRRATAARSRGPGSTRGFGYRFTRETARAAGRKSAQRRAERSRAAAIAPEAPGGPRPITVPIDLWDDVEESAPAHVDDPAPGSPILDFAPGGEMQLTWARRRTTDPPRSR
jgi:hypothetical protein